MTTIKASVFASGTGSNFDAIMEQHDTLGCEIVLLVCDQPEAPVIQKAEERGINVFIFNPKAYESKEAYEKAILAQLIAHEIDWIFLAGYMRLIGPTILHVYQGQLINIHPSLLPQFPGKNAIHQAMDAGVTKTGVTIHYVDEGMDTGPIIVQEEVSINPDDTIETLQKRIQKVEHQLYPKTIRELMRYKVVQEMETV